MLKAIVLSSWLVILYATSIDLLVPDHQRQVVQFRSPGDLMIGGLFSMQSAALNVTNRTKPQTPPCERYDSIRVLPHLAMRFAIDEINNSTKLLPNVKLGYEIYDICLESLVAMRSTMMFLSKYQSDVIEVQCNYTDYSTRVTAIIGPGSSELAIVISRLFSFFLIPQISYSASSELLSDKKKFPSFFRTIPSDKKQAEAMALLVKEFQWNWVAAIGTDDEYGRRGMEKFVELASEKGVCITYEDLIPIHETTDGFSEKIEQIVNNLVETEVNVTVIFADDRYVDAFMNVVIQQQVTDKVWIGSEAWITDANVARIQNISSVGTVIGVGMKSGEMPGFEAYVSKILSDPAIKESISFSLYSNNTSGFCMSGDEDEVCRSQCKECETLTAENFTTIIDSPSMRVAFNVYSAVYAVAHALHKILKCDNGDFASAIGKSELHH
nr:PREDICTED: taste receptor type 1 member 3-like [Latimeria chalumnae]|eukprot:XP_014344371.1 PREDICTED: taste receptor type 1 member 3-like [Latimeria chalumnae]